MRRVLISCSLLWLCFIAQEAGAATQCNDVYPGARIGPPPEWIFWADGSACFVRWQVSGPVNELLERCRSTRGVRFVHFEHTKGSEQSLCIFKILDMAKPPKIDQNMEHAPSLADDESAEANEFVVINLAAIELSAVGMPSKKQINSHKKQASQKKLRFGKIIAPADARDQKKTPQRREKRRRGCFSTIWQCSPT